jgi:hypothetical protein
MVRRQWATTASGQTISTRAEGIAPRIAAHAVMVLPRPTSSASKNPGRPAARAAAIAATASVWCARSAIAPVGVDGGGSAAPLSARSTWRSHEYGAAANGASAAGSAAPSQTCTP